MPKSKKEQKKEIKNLTAPVYNLSGKIVGKQTLPAEIFGMESSPALVAQAVRIYSANQRLGTKNTRTRSEVSGSTRKIYRQKGTGRARHGDIKAPIFIGGGIAHGPKPKDYSLNFPKKMRRKALFAVLSDALTHDRIKIVQGLESIQAKTKELIAVFEHLELSKKAKVLKKVLLVLSGDNKNVVLAGRNIERLTIAPARLLTTYDILTHPTVVLMKSSVSVLEHTFLPKEKSEKETAVESTVSVHPITKETKSKKKTGAKRIVKQKSKTVTKKK